MSDIKHLQEKLKIKYLQRTNLKLKGHNVFSASLRKTNKEIRALEEGARDFLSQAGIAAAASKEAGQNNYDDYEKQVEAAYEMYNAKSKYGAEVLGGIVDARTAFTGGEGISIVSEKPATEQFLKQFIKDNRLDGSRYIDMIRTGELEGRNLLILNNDPEKETGVKVTSFRWRTYKYIVHADGYDKEQITRVTYKDGDTEKELKENYTFVRLGGTWDKINETPPKIAKVLTDIEDFSRSKYDMRKSNHLFARTTPWMQTDDNAEARAYMSAVESGEWNIGDGYAGNGMLHLIGPTSDSAKVITDEQVALLRIISMATSIPIHWLAHPDLMSNRATAENLVEVVKAGTQIERITWEESLEVLFRKAMDMAIDSGKYTNDIIGPFEVKLPFVSMMEIVSIVEALKSSVDEKYISIETFQQKLPGIDPELEKVRLKKQYEEAAERAPDMSGDDNNDDDNNNEGVTVNE